jgi:type 1 glutamine amidotransferase
VDETAGVDTETAGVDTVTAGMDTVTAGMDTETAGMEAGASGNEAGPAGSLPRVLIFSKTAGFRHQNIEHGVEVLARLASQRGVGLEATEDAEVFHDTGLSAYDAVIFLSTTGDVLDDVQQGALVRFVRSGGGYVGIHAASDTEYDWPWYGELVGGYFDGHPGGPNVREGVILPVDRAHPATAHLPSPWIRTDEWYDIRNLQEGVSVLLDVDETSYKRPSEQPAAQPRPIAWYREFDGGRTFYTALGHTSESFDEAHFLDHVWGGLTWVLASAEPSGS